MVPTLHDVSARGKRVLLRVDYNVPLKDGSILDDRRITATLPTISALLEDGAEQVIIISHLGRPGGKKVQGLSLRPVAAKLQELLGEKVAFAGDAVGESAMPDGRLIMLENLRFDPGEEADDKAFARRLAKLGDLYVTDAFAALHRRHASVDACPRLFREKAAGLLVQRELQNLDFSEPERPFIAVIGAAKITDKIAMLRSLLARVDRLLLGGAIIFPFFRALGYETGKSLCEESAVPLARELLDAFHDKIILPKDVVISEELEGSEIFTVDADKIPPAMKGLDIGDLSAEEFKRELENARTIFWNGPLGVYEVPPFDTATKEVAEFLAKQKARVVIGGGDTVSVIDRFGLSLLYTFVSTGGGAALQYVAGERLPGLEALR